MTYNRSSNPPPEFMSTSGCNECSINLRFRIEISFEYFYAGNWFSAICLTFTAGRSDSLTYSGLSEHHSRLPLASPEDTGCSHWRLDIGILRWQCYSNKPQSHLRNTRILVILSSDRSDVFLNKTAFRYFGYRVKQVRLSLAVKSSLLHWFNGHYTKGRCCHCVLVPHVGVTCLRT